MNQLDIAKLAISTYNRSSENTLGAQQGFDVIIEVFHGRILLVLDPKFLMNCSMRMHSTFRVAASCT